MTMDCESAVLSAGVDQWIAILPCCRGSRTVYHESTMLSTRGRAVGHESTVLSSGQTSISEASQEDPAPAVPRTPQHYPTSPTPKAQLAVTFIVRVITDRNVLNLQNIVINSV
jgi:hypothetical protein